MLSLNQVVKDNETTDYSPSTYSSIDLNSTFNQPSFNQPTDDEIKVGELMKVRDQLQVKLDSLKFRQFQLFNELEKVKGEMKTNAVEFRQVIKDIHLLTKGVTLCPSRAEGLIEDEKTVKRRREVKNMTFEQMISSAQNLSEFDKVKLMNCLKDLKDKLNK